jgi:hypothetical protein
MLQKTYVITDASFKKAWPARSLSFNSFIATPWLLYVPLYTSVVIIIMYYTIFQDPYTACNLKNIKQVVQHSISSSLLHFATPQYFKLNWLVSFIKYKIGLTMTFNSISCIEKDYYVSGYYCEGLIFPIFVEITSFMILFFDVNTVTKSKTKLITLILILANFTTYIVILR